MYVCCFIFYDDVSAVMFVFFFFKQKTAYEMRISDWSSDVCSSDLLALVLPHGGRLTLHDVDDQCVRQAAGYARILHPTQLHQLRPQAGKIDRRHGAFM